MRTTFLISALSVLVVLLTGANGFLWFSNSSNQVSSFAPAAVGIAGVDQKNHGRIMKFLKLFVDKVLQKEGEVDFDDRLKLENAIREIGNQSALDKWQAFVNSATNEEAQQHVKDLLKILVDSLGEYDLPDL